jgi:hypothetical protein
MPYKIVKSGSGYKVKNKETGKTYSKEPMSKAKAQAQMRAMYANMHEAEHAATAAEVNRGRRLKK